MGLVTRVGKLWHKLGYRGKALLWFASLDFLFALSLLNPPRNAPAQAAYHYVAVIGGFRFWGLLWLAVGLICAYFAFKKADQAAWAGAIFLKVIWSSLFFLAWILDDADRAWISAVIWISFAGFVALLSGWPEPERLP